MRPITNTIDAKTNVTDAVKALSAAPFSQLPVVDSENRYIGVITAKAVLDHIDSVELEDQVSIDKLCVNPGSVTATATLHDCVRALSAADGLALPVTDDNGDVVGWLTAALVITAMNKHTPSQSGSG
ncbi:MAG: CBS domain-containing protein [Antricoccus sp.]